MSGISGEFLSFFLSASASEDSLWSSLGVAWSGASWERGQRRKSRAARRGVGRRCEVVMGLVFIRLLFWGLFFGGL